MKNVKASLEALTKIFKKSRVEKLIEKLDLIADFSNKNIYTKEKEFDFLNYIKYKEIIKLPDFNEERFMNMFNACKNSRQKIQNINLITPFEKSHWSLADWDESNN